MSSFWGDGPRSLFETYRVFRGDTPFREMAALYPPLSLYIFAAFYKLFGQTFETAQILIDILSTVVILSTYGLARQVLPRLTSGAITVCLVLVGLSSDSSFALYSLNMYAPSALLAAASLNLFLIALTKAVGSRSIQLTWGILASAGASGAVLSRTEFIVPVFACLSLIGLQQWDIRHRSGRGYGYAAKVLALQVLILSPAIVVYALLVANAGLHAVGAGLMNYGNATMVCPYWPTGIGLLGFLAGLGEAGLVYSTAALLLGRPNRTRTYRLLWGAVVAILVTGAYLYAAWDAFPRYWALPDHANGSSVRESLGGLLALTHLLVPVMSVTVISSAAMIGGLARGLLKRKMPSATVTAETLLIAASAALCIRSLFGTLWTELPGLSSFAYPVLFVIAAILLHKVVSSAANQTTVLRARIGKAIPLAIFWVYGLSRLGYFFASGNQYYPLDTLAGRVFLKDRTSGIVYAYVVSHTAAGDPIADLSYYGGAVNFAARRPAPLFMTTFAFCAPEERYLQLDAERIKAVKPKLVLGNNDNRLGTRYGGGTTTGCTFPHLVWRSGRVTGDPSRTLPVVLVVKSNYSQIYRTGNIQILQRNGLPDAKSTQ
jgi:hypothetical protein